MSSYYDNVKKLADVLTSLRTKLNAWIGYESDALRIMNEDNLTNAKAVQTEINFILDNLHRDIPSRIVWDFLQVVEPMEQYFNSASIDRGISDSRLSSLNNGIENHLIVFFDKSHQIVIYILAALGENESRVEVLELIEKTRENIGIEYNSIIEYNEKIKKLFQEVNDVRNNVVDAAQDYAVAKFGKNYEEMANENRKAANIWLMVVALLIAGTGALAVYMLVQEEQYVKDNMDILKYPSAIFFVLGPRLVFFSVLFVGIGLSVKMYKANKHNQVLNKHRQNALNTFETFIKSSHDDKGTKDAILLEVTRTIFGNQNTGFNSNEGDSDSYSKIVEIVKGGSGGT